MSIVPLDIQRRFAPKSGGPPVSVIAALARLVEAGEPMSGARQQLLQVRAGANPITK